MKRSIARSLIVVALPVILGVKVAFAAPDYYIDPNTGGMLFQILAVAFTLLSGFIFFFSSRIRMTFARFMRFLREKMGKPTAPNSLQDSPE